MKIKFLKSYLFLLILLVFSVSCQTNQYNYSIEDYKLILEPRINSLDVKVTLEITYLVNGPESKSDGFKFVGDNVVDSLLCFDETGKLTTNIEYLKETRISWQFNPVRSGRKKINATFMLRDAITKKENGYTINIPWAGVFRIPVAKATYEIIWHQELKRIKFKKAMSWEHRLQEGIEYYDYQQSPLTEKTIKVHFE